MYYPTLLLIVFFIIGSLMILSMALKDIITPGPSDYDLEDWFMFFILLFFGLAPLSFIPYLLDCLKNM